MSGAIDMLPKGGEKFSALGFKKKLKTAVKSSSLMNSLSSNQEAINKAVYKARHLIAKGAFKYTQQQSALSQINKSANLTAGQKILVRKVLKHLGDSGNVSHAQINRADEQEIEAPHLANQPQLANRSGLSGVSSPGLNRPSARPMVSISQAQAERRGSGLAGGMGTLNPSTPSSPPSRPPMIPLSR
ncbi:MAG: hypothetical protein PHG95_01715 [Patescibacteria group bacterium]|nr:hypothetical protein [Patescibacteria group bacterium]